LGKAPPAGIASGIPQKKVLTQFFEAQQLQEDPVISYQLSDISYRLLVICDLPLVTGH
jgi:hypothetical protein